MQAWSYAMVPSVSTPPPNTSTRVVCLRAEHAGMMLPIDTRVACAEHFIPATRTDPPALQNYRILTSTSAAPHSFHVAVGCEQQVRPHSLAATRERRQSGVLRNPASEAGVSSGRQGFRVACFASPSDFPTDGSACSHARVRRSHSGFVSRSRPAVWT